VLEFVAGHIHSWMMLSNRITEKRRLDTAAPAIKTRMITRSSARVFGPEACLRNAFPSVAAIMGVVGQGKKDVAQGRVSSSTKLYVNTFTGCSALQFTGRQDMHVPQPSLPQT
jgi:hypothetical protein